MLQEIDRNSGERSLRISLIIPTRNRATILDQTLNNLIDISKDLNAEIVIVDGNSSDNTQEVVEMHRKVSTTPIKYYKSEKRDGSSAACNTGVTLSDGDIVLWLGDDMTLPNSEVIKILLDDFQKFPDVSVIGGKRIETHHHKVDPPFYLRFGDFFTKLTGFVFLDVFTKMRYADFVVAPIACRRKIAQSVLYDKNYGVGMGYREESDYQLQIRASGWRILFDPRIRVDHNGQETGGNRDETYEKRIFWKARNHTYYLHKFYSGLRLWYYLNTSIYILALNGRLHFRLIASGIRTGFVDYQKYRK